MKNLWHARVTALFGVAVLTSSFLGCTQQKESGASTASVSNGKAPVFSLAWSEYPSWSVFGVAHEAGLIDAAEGKMGSIEKKHNVDIVLKQAEYDPCIQFYGTGNVDAVCITNMDILGPSLTKKSVLLFPTSTSAGADACIVDGSIADIEGLKGQPSHGLERSVSQYCFERVLEKRGFTPSDFKFSNMDPGAAAQAFQGNDAAVKSIVVWNPFVLQVQKTRQDAKVLFDSSDIPEEIVDMVIASEAAMKRPGAKQFADALMDAFYEVSRGIDNPETSDEMLIALADKFVKGLTVDEMKTVVTQTKFYKTPADAIRLLESESFQQVTMPSVVKFCKEHGIVEIKEGEDLNVGFSDPTAQLNLTTQYLKSYADSAQTK